MFQGKHSKVGLILIKKCLNPRMVGQAMNVTWYFKISGWLFDNDVNCFFFVILS